jgi:hypothetical protein
VLDTGKGQAYSPTAVRRIPFRTSISTLDEEHMGSTPYGNANPMTLIGLAMPQDIETGRDGSGRVRVGGRT